LSIVKFKKVESTDDDDDALMMMNDVFIGQALISGDTLQPAAYTGLPQYPGLGGFGMTRLQSTFCFSLVFSTV